MRFRLDPHTVSLHHFAFQSEDRSVSQLTKDGTHTIHGAVPTNATKCIVIFSLSTGSSEQGREVAWLTKHPNMSPIMITLQTSLVSLHLQTEGSVSYFHPLPIRSKPPFELILVFPVIWLQRNIFIDPSAIFLCQRVFFSMGLFFT